MTDFTKTTNFTAKDNLTTGDALKVIKGSYFDTEFDNIATAITSKYDSNDLASQAQAEAGTNNLTLMTPLRCEQHVQNWAGENDAMVEDIQALNLAADAVLGWDQSAGAAIGFTLGAGLSFSTTTLNLASAVAGAGMTMTSQVLNVIAGDGITVNANDIALKSTVPGAGLTMTSGVVNVIGGAGITANANDIAVSLGDAFTWTGNHIFQEAITATDEIFFTGVITPTELGSGSSTDNYAPAGFATANILRLSAAGTASLTGLAGGADGRVILLLNIGSFTINLLDENASSTAANRFRTTGSGQSLNENACMMIIYDGTSSRWRTFDTTA